MRQSQEYAADRDEPSGASITTDDVQVLARLAGLPLTPQRAALLVDPLRSELRSIQRIRAIILDDGTPPAAFAPNSLNVTDLLGVSTADTSPHTEGANTTGAAPRPTTNEETTDGAR